VRFLVDAQLPARLARFLGEVGHDALHTSDLPDRNRSTDAQIAERADRDGRVVVTKDRDFRDSHLLTRSPRQLLVVATGNITNAALMSLFEANHEAIVTALTEVDFVEVGPDSLVLHRRRDDTRS
jgi:predicted nuclease of predicted toxin-antitoxin system